MDLDAAKPLGISGFIQCLQMWMQHCINRPSSLELLLHGQLTDEQKLAIGNWTDQARVATTPARCSAKVHTVTSTQVEPLGGLRYFGAQERWQDVSQRYL